MLEALAASSIGGVLCLDRIFLQVMLSRPVVVGAVIGVILQEPYTGLITGSLVELFWIDQSQIGTFIPPNDSLATVVITASTIISGQALGGSSRELIALAVLLCIPFGLLGKEVDVLIMRINSNLSRKALARASAGDGREISRNHLFGLFRHLLTNFIFLLLFISLVQEILLWVYPNIPERLFAQLKYIYFFFPLLGVGVALNTIKFRGVIPVFCGIFLISTFIIEWIH